MGGGGKAEDHHSTLRIAKSWEGLSPILPIHELSSFSLRNPERITSESRTEFTFHSCRVEFS
jgi:hypothetical protein